MGRHGMQHGGGMALRGTMLCTPHANAAQYSMACHFGGMAVGGTPLQAWRRHGIGWHNAHNILLKYQKSQGQLPVAEFPNPPMPNCPTYTSGTTSW